MTGLEKGKVYFFRVKSLNRWGVSPPSLPSAAVALRDAGTPRLPEGGFLSMVKMIVLETLCRHACIYKCSVVHGTIFVELADPSTLIPPVIEEEPEVEGQEEIKELPGLYDAIIIIIDGSNE